MAIDDGLPGAHEQARVDRAANRTDELLDIHAGAWRLQRVEEHPLLHRGELVDVLDVVGRSRHYDPRSLASSLSSSR